MPLAPFRFDRRFSLPESRPRVWEVLQRLDEYPAWWSWLQRFSVDGPPAAAGQPEAIAVGTEAHCVVRGPLPYELRFSVELTQVEAPALVVASVRGGLEGPARLELREAGSGCEARLAWEVTVQDPALRAAARVARPLMIWGHDVIVDRGWRQFRQRALAETPT